MADALLRLAPTPLVSSVIGRCPRQAPRPLFCDHAVVWYKKAAQHPLRMRTGKRILKAVVVPMKSALGVCVPLLVLLSGCYTPYQLAIANTNQCMRIPWYGPPILAGTRVTLVQCLGRTDNQQWTVKNNQIAGVAGMCLDVQDGVAADGAPVIAVPCNGSPGQHWRVSNGQVIGPGGKCLDVPGGAVAESAPLILATCTGAASQRWSLR
jgi:hypothetical protein